MKYTNFNLNDDLQKGLQAAKYFECLPVQNAVLDKGIDGSDLYVQSQTGTGKTAGYLVTVLERWLKMQEKQKVLILVPTRELAVQVCDEAKLLSKFIKIDIAAFFGGVAYEPQIKKINSGVDIIIGTPGRIIDLCERKNLNFDNVGFLIVDEADRMFDMGFYPDVRRLLQFLPAPEKRQTMLFSATLSTYIKNLAWECTVNAKEITMQPENITAKKIEQKLFHVADEKKMQLLLGILNREKCDAVLIFCNTKNGTEILAKRLRLNNFSAEFLSGDLPQKKRLNLITRFKQKSVPILIATDVAARGIDVDDLKMVINYELPNEAANYVHRIGRTARAGKNGVTYALCSERDVYNLAEIEKFIEETIPASIPDESLYLDDLSSGQYIHLGKPVKSKPYNRNSRKFDNERKKLNHKGKKHSSQNTRNSKNRNIKFNNKQKSENLASLSFEERMEYYKKRYAKNIDINANSIEKNKKKKKPIQQKKKQNFKKNSEVLENTKKINNKLSPENKIVSFFKGIFSKN
ncbi:MAG: RNA helicase [Treponema sp.]|nr:MAG: RNA helicase [Treponema sp.]